MASTHPITRLVGRYGSQHGMYLYGEYCLLEALGLEAFRRRHTAAQLDALAAQLAPLDLWPSSAPAGAEPGRHTPEAVANSFFRPALAVGMGIDIFHACLAWASSQGDVQADPGAWFEGSRTQLFQSLGFSFPPMRVTLDHSLSAHAYRIYIWGEGVAEGEAFPGQDLMRGPDDASAPLLPYPWTPDPVGKGWVTWLPIGPGAAPPPELERLHWIAALDRHVHAALKRSADRLVTVPLTHALLSLAEAEGYDHELERYVSVPELRLVFRELVRQGLRLEPARMLELMLMGLMRDLAGRDQPPSELERLVRQLPVYSTPRLVALVRKGLGLAEAPGLTLHWPGSPPPEPALGPAVAPEEAERWRTLARALESQRAPVQQWLRVLRTLVQASWQRTGFGVRWSYVFPRERRVPPMPAELAQNLIASGRLPVAQRQIDRFVELTERVGEIVLWLEGPDARRLSAPAQAMLGAPAWVDYAWIVAAPARQLAELAVPDWAAGLPASGI